MKKVEFSNASVKEGKEEIEVSDDMYVFCKTIRELTSQIARLGNG